MSSECSSCKASILWATSFGTGKPMPVDPEPSPKGALRIARRPDGSIVATPVPAKARTGTLHISHFATCPNAKSHRKTRSP